eukprot:gene3713-7380_t
MTFPVTSLNKRDSIVAKLRLPVERIPFDIVRPSITFGFNKAFYDPIVLTDLLNGILDHRKDNPIVELSYLNQVFPNSYWDPLEHNDPRVDIICKTQNDRHVLIKMKVDYRKDFENNSLFELGHFSSNVNSEESHDLLVDREKLRRIGSSEFKVTDFWQKIDEVCMVVINPGTIRQKNVNEAVTDEEPSVIDVFGMRSTIDHTPYPGLKETNVVSVTLANFNKAEDELETVKDRWLFALKDESIDSSNPYIRRPLKRVSDISKVAAESEALKLFYSILYTENIPSENLTNYKRRVLESNTMYSECFDQGYKKGFDKGYKEGFENALNSNKKMKQQCQQFTFICLNATFAKRRVIEEVCIPDSLLLQQKELLITATERVEKERRKRRQKTEGTTRE